MAPAVRRATNGERASMRRLRHYGRAGVLVQERDRDVCAGRGELEVRSLEAVVVVVEAGAGLSGEPYAEAIAR